MISREVKEGAQLQGADERIYYSITTSPWGSSPTSVSVRAYDETSSNLDVTATVLSETASVSGDIIILPLLSNLTHLHTYRIEVLFSTAEGNVLEAYVHVRCIL